MAKQVGGRTIPLNDPYGLSFDIYERIDLSEETPAIEQLEQVSLSPHIEVVEQEEKAVLRGHLLLNGSYQGKLNNSEQLEHHIPVEITVPLYRIRCANNIGVEIENLDVNVLSPRTLNVTGVLSLHGIENTPVEQPLEWHSEEEFTVEHIRQQPFVVEAEHSAHYNDPSEQQEYMQDLHSSDVEHTTINKDINAEPTIIYEQHVQGYSSCGEDGERTTALFEKSSLLEVPVSQAHATSAHHLDSLGEKLEHAHLSKDVTLPEQYVLNHTNLTHQPEHCVERSTKDGICSVLRNSSVLQDPLPLVQVTDVAAMQDEETAKEKTKWKGLLLKNSREEGHFRKLKLCIVQPSETLGMIADRYQTTSHELSMYNKLSNPLVEAGQILYIP